jgi:hypothetical protein
MDFIQLLDLRISPLRVPVLLIKLHRLIVIARNFDTELINRSCPKSM